MSGSSTFSFVSVVLNVGEVTWVPCHFGVGWWAHVFLLGHNTVGQKALSELENVKDTPFMTLLVISAKLSL